MANVFLAGPANVDILVGDQLIGTATTLLDSSIAIGSSAEDIRGGLSARLYGKYYHTSTFDVTLTDTMFKLEYLAFQTGSTVSQIADIFITQEVTLTTGGAGSLPVDAKTPVSYDTYGTIGWARKAGDTGTPTTITFTGKNFTIPGGTAGDVYCVKYVASDANSKSITISSAFIPDEVTLVMTSTLFKGGKTDSINSSSKAGIVQTRIPRFQFAGAQTISMTSTGAAQMPLSGHALSNEANTCSGDAYYAIVSQTLNGENWYDDVFALAIENGDVDVAVSGTETLSVYALPKNRAAFIPPYEDLTFTSASGATATVSSTGVVTGVAAGDTVVTVTITSKTSVQADVGITVS